MSDNWTIEDKGWLGRVFSDVSKQVRRWPKRTCEQCFGKGTKEYETYEGGFDRTFSVGKCQGCGGKGIIGGGQPGLQLWFQSNKERDEFKARVLRMRGIKWTDESASVLETETKPRWKG